MKSKTIQSYLTKVPVNAVTFTSTRNPSTTLSFWQSIVQGMASDGGLLVPKQIPKLPSSLLLDATWWKTSKPSDYATIISRMFIPRDVYSDEELITSIQKALNFDIPLESLDEHTHVLRLDRGRTASFKDIAARTLSVLMNAYAIEHSKKINIVVATSGDTGVAIADAFGNSSACTVTVLYPAHGVSEIQEKQMIQVHHEYTNEQVIPIKGNFDTCQDIAKLLQAARELSLTDTQAKQQFIEDCTHKLKIKLTNSEVDELLSIVHNLDLSSANSINIWRLIPQTTQYFTAYGELVKSGKIKPGQQIVFAVPTGNVGHLMAGIYAREMGLPIKQFIVGTNTNNILANIIGSGIVRHRPFTPSSAPSMDILDPSNLERLLYFAAQKTNNKKTIDYVGMKKDIKNIEHDHQMFPLNVYNITDEMITFLQELVWAEDIETDEEMFAMMRQTYAQKNIVLEPHGITALIAVIRSLHKNTILKNDHVVIFETAHPDKFPDALMSSGLAKVKKYKHPILEKLKKVSIQRLGKPKAQDINLLNVARNIFKLSKKTKLKSLEVIET